MAEALDDPTRAYPARKVAQYSA